MNDLYKERMSKDNAENKVVYTVPEIMDILCISRESAYRLVQSKVFKSFRVGRLYRINKESFDCWLASITEWYCQGCDPKNRILNNFSNR